MESKDFFQMDIVLENDRVRLEPFTLAHAERLRPHVFDEELSFVLSCRSDAEATAYFNSVLERRETGFAYPFAVIDKRTNEAAGTTSLGLVRFDNLRLEIGWTWYGAAYRGTGLNRACKFELLRYAFETLGFRRVQLSADVDNLRSQRAILKLGAVREGVFRANYLDAAGESRDDVYFSIIHSDWERVKRTVFADLAGSGPAEEVGLGHG